MSMLWFLSLMSGCNSYDYYRVAGFEQASFSNEADILFVIDNSPSMVDESEGLAVNFNSFIQQFTAAESQAEGEALADAVTSYVTYVSNRGELLDYQLAVTTTSASTSGAPGDAGALVGDGVITQGEEGISDRFIEALICDASCWQTCLEGQEQDCIDSDGSTLGDDGVIDHISTEILDEVCGVAQWDDHCGSGNEEPIEAAFLSLCRSLESPPDSCRSAETNLDSSDYGSNVGFVRDDATVVIVIMTDEGDNSRRLYSGEKDPQVYLDLFEEMGLTVRFAVFGPPFDPSSTDYSCIAGADPWGVERLYNLTTQTGGRYYPLWSDAKDSAGDCTYESSDFAGDLSNLGALLNGLTNLFPLQSIPDVDSIHAYVNGEEVELAPLSDEGAYGDGWSYSSALNAVEFHGSAIPDYNADVRIYYQPLEGMPRELPDGF